MRSNLLQTKQEGWVEGFGYKRQLWSTQSNHTTWLLLFTGYQFPFGDGFCGGLHLGVGFRSQHRKRLMKPLIHPIAQQETV